METNMDNLQKARSLLDSGNYTCVVCKEETVYTTTQRGVAPLLNWLDEGTDLIGASAADRVVGRGAAFLYCLLEVKEVHARVMSHPAQEVLQAHGIRTSADAYVPGIINRTGTGPCPFEAAVLEIRDAQAALIAIREKRRQMQAGN
jgi:hypothetical protein